VGARQPRASPSLSTGQRRGRTQSGHIRRTTGDHSLSSPASPNKLICGDSLPSDDPAWPPVPRSAILKEILGKLIGL